MWMRTIRQIGALMALASLAGVAACQPPLPERNKRACQDWVDHMLNLTCLYPDGEVPSDEDPDMICDAFVEEQTRPDSPFAECDLTDFFECLIEQYSCVGGEVAIGGEVIPDLSGFEAFLLLVPFQTCESTLDDETCSPLNQPPTAP